MFQLVNLFWLLHIVISGYIKGDKETHTEIDSTWSVIVSGGWLRTGDLCYIDEEGFLYVVDRLKELIKYKGYQVYVCVCVCV